MKASHNQAIQDRSKTRRKKAQGNWELTGIIGLAALIAGAHLAK
jgi:hypothetical protein